MHRRRQAYKGDHHEHHRIFTVKKTRGHKSLRYDVYMASNMTESTFNYRVYDNFKDGTSIIFAQDKVTLHIQVTKQKDVKKEEKFSVSVSPNVDKAFVSALLIIREEVRKSRYKGYES
ncbi:putative tubby-like protein [Helianthus anomalus]